MWFILIYIKWLCPIIFNHMIRVYTHSVWIVISKFKIAKIKSLKILIDFDKLAYELVSQVWAKPNLSLSLHKLIYLSHWIKKSCLGLIQFNLV